ncbi:hypothetical protein [Capnocytophaga granulosa]|uniref:hypothetical protein n=1 Tax=Capnocytophaga granulosa TaxID=45242 RepID=UPI00204D3919|nr:hypothetical protein [Capnocytophaga granulosa]DAI55977.1 MAG TPA: hypothetical protein [Bacteriophage sp.]DAQ06435.1 MAG TPA: hypothetical protein [Bacteriophage sp.]DAT73608.1 MAG TPA: hypothetical protein [Caudoviricetes sp.]
MKTLFWLAYILSFIVFVISSILWNLYEVGAISIYISLHIFFFCLVYSNIYPEKVKLPAHKHLK